MGLLQRIFGTGGRRHAVPRTEIRRFLSLQDADKYGWEMVWFFLKEETVRFDRERIKSYVYYILLRKDG